MQEYIVYAILIFLPVGVLMEYLLRREGLVLKYRLIIITASLAIIISFPILMGNMGIPLALIVYMVSIFALSWYFIRVARSPAWYLQPVNRNASDEVFVSERLIDSTKILTIGDIEDEMWPQESEAELSADKAEDSYVTESLLQESVESDDLNNISLLEQVDQEQVDESSKQANDNINQQPGEYSLTEYEEQEKSLPSITAPAELAEDDVLYSENLTADIICSEDNPQPMDRQIDSPESITEIIPEYTETETAALLDSEIIIDDLQKDPGFAAALNHEEMDEPISTANDVTETGLTPKMDDINHKEDISSTEDINPTEDIPSTEDVVLNEPIETPDQAEIMPVESEGDPNSLTETNLLDKLIENAFALKQEQRSIEAAELFKEALDLASDEELRFLLIMEMVNLYSDLGMYSQAEQVLFISIGKAYTRTDIIDKINRQLSYIRLLSVELDRLGLANTPISEVPRLVKMSVDEIMEV